MENLPFDLVLKIFEIDPWNNKGMMLVCSRWAKALESHKGKLPSRSEKHPVLAGIEILYDVTIMEAFSLKNLGDTINLIAPEITADFRIDLEEWTSMITAKPCSHRINPIHPLHGKRLTVKRLEWLDGVSAGKRRTKNTGRKI